MANTISITSPRTSRLASHPRLRRFLANRLAVAGAVVLLVMVVLAIFPGIVTSTKPNVQVLTERFRHPGHGHLLGTDSLGRDNFTRVIYGTRTSLIAGLQATTMAVVIGVPLGMVAAFAHGWRQSFLDRLNDGMMSLPALLLAIVIVAVLGPGLVNAMLGIGIAFFPRFYRIARAASQQVKEETFIEASRAIGCSRTQVLARHVLPNIASTIIVQAALTFGSVVLSEASLSFLGLGVQPPTPSWGGMLQDASNALFRGPYLVYGPAFMLILTVMAFQFAADGLRDALGGPGSALEGAGR